MDERQTVRTLVLPGLGNAPSLDTGMPHDLHFAVDLGMVCANAWLDLKSKVRLREYVANQADAFSRRIAASMRNAGDIDPHGVAASREAFLAGLMGGIQQHLLAALGIVTCDPRTMH